MRICAIVGGLLCLCAVVLIAASSGKEVRFSSRAESKANVLRRNINAEVKDLGEHTWAGTYYEGDGLGVSISLLLAPKAGYVFEGHRCLGQNDRNYGGVSCINDRIQLSFTFPNEPEGFQGISPEFLPVSWGPRKYLIPPNDIVEFCNSVNAGTEPREDIYGRHLLRRGDEEKSVDGFPDVPTEFQPYLQKEPIITEIVAIRDPQMRPSVANWKFKDTPLTLKGGNDIGLRPGMALYVTSPDRIMQLVRISDVLEHSAEGVMTQIDDKSPDPQIGWKLSTRLRRASQNRSEETAKSPGGR